MTAATLTRVSVERRDLERYVDAAGEEAVARVRDAARPLVGARVLHVSSTPYGGGVAEHLRSHVPLMEDLGVAAEWAVIDPSDGFSAITKALHNGLQGLDVAWNAEMEGVYADVLRAHAVGFDGDWDAVVVHDPQPAALLTALDDLGDGHRDAAWVWRCHIDLTSARPDVWAFMLPAVRAHDVSVWTMDQFVPDSLGDQPVAVFPPGIDPLAEKNADVADGFVDRACRAHGLDPDRPLVLQVSRFDRWKDPTGVIEAFAMVREDVPDAQLALVGSMAADDPEGPGQWERAHRAAELVPSVHLLADLDDRVVNALQRAADVVVQKSIREGFGLTVSEALWKGRPVVGGRAGGITLQVRDGVDGFLVDSVEEAAARIAEVVGDADLGRRLGESGRRRVRERFLVTAELEEYLRLLSSLLLEGDPSEPGWISRQAD